MSNRRKLRNRKIHDMPPSVGTLVDRLMQVDAAWFRRNPGQKVVVRDYVPGEAWPFHAPLGSRVTITLVGPGVRVRRFSDGTEVLDVDPPARKQVAA